MANRNESQNIQNVCDAFVHACKRRKLFRRAVAVLCALVALLTMNFLQESAVTMTGDDLCSLGLAEHVHSEECYSSELVCDLEEKDPVIEVIRIYTPLEAHAHTEACRDENGNIVCGYVEKEYYHTHNPYCYDESGNLVCSLETKKEHIHTEACYAEAQALVCALEESEGHTHTDACYTETRELTCGQEESEGHFHENTCYAMELTCGQEEGEDHTHADICYNEVLTCGKAEGESAHTHAEDCYTISHELTCGLDETEGHTHTEECYEHEINLICGQDMAEKVAAKMGLDQVQLHAHDIKKCFNTVVRTVNGETMNVQVAVCGCMEVQTLVSSPDNWVEETVVIDAGHAHTEDCYAIPEEPNCGLTEHTHTLACIWTNNTEIDEESTVEPTEEPTAAPTEEPAAEAAEDFMEPEENPMEALAQDSMVEVVEGQAEASAEYDNALADLSEALSYTVDVGSTITISGAAAGENHFWSSDKTDIATVSESGNAATVTGLAAGTVIITHEYGDKKQGNKNNSKETFTVMVAEVTAIGDEDCQAQSGSLDGLTVTVKETGNLKKLSGYYVAVADVRNAYSEDDSVLAAYHIYLADENHEEVSAEDLENGQLNLKVTLTYDVLPDWYISVNDVKHYKNGDEQFINNIKIDGDSKSISFIVHGFSEFTINSGSTTTTGGGSTISVQEGSILDRKTFNDANEWQIVSGKYINNDESAKDPNTSADGMVRVQKNVIPTETENEFWVYLSLDYNQKQTWKSFFESVTYLATESANFHGAAGSIQNSMTGNSQVQVAAHEYSGYKRTNIFEIYDSSGKYLTSQQLWWGSENKNPNNFTIYIKLSNNRYFIVGAKLSKDESDNNKLVRLQLTAEAETILYDELSKKITINEVVDQMGEYIEYLGEATGDLGTVNYSKNERNLTWAPLVKDNPQREEKISGNTKTIWYKNVAELLYKVRLDVTKNGFNSCANNMDSTINEKESYKVNNYATLTYDTNKTVDFPIPYVRGLLYDVVGSKIEQGTTTGLSGATFTFDGTDVYEREHSDTTISDNSGLFSFIGYPASKGSYTITETKPPVGYKLSSTTKKEIMLNYTNDANGFVQSTKDVTHMMPKDSANTLKFENPPVEITVIKVWDDDNNSKNTRPNPPEATVQLIQNNEFYGEAVTLNKGGEWKYTWSKLPQWDSEGNEIEYKVEEKPVPTGYTVHVSSTGQEGFYVGNGDLTFTVTNTPIQFKAKITKVDQSGRPLAGATLNVLDLKLTDTQINAIRESGSTDLTTGQLRLDTPYTISESEAPAGYILLPEPITFKVVADSTAADGYRLEDSSGVPLSKDSKLKLVVTIDEATGQVTLDLRLTNDAGVSLPSTGGPGVSYLLGFTVVFLACVSLILRRGKGRT